MGALQVHRQALAADGVHKVPGHLHHSERGQQDGELGQLGQLGRDELRKKRRRKQNGLGVAGGHQKALAVNTAGGEHGRLGLGIGVGRCRPAVRGGGWRGIGRVLHRRAPALDAQPGQVGRAGQAQGIEHRRKALQQCAQPGGRQAHHDQQCRHAARHRQHGSPHAVAGAGAHHQQHVGAGRGRHHKRHRQKQPPGTQGHARSPFRKAVEAIRLGDTPDPVAQINCPSGRC